MNERFYDSVEAFDQVSFDYPFDTFYIKSDRHNGDCSFVFVNTEDGKFIFHITNEYLEEKKSEYALNVVNLGFNEWIEERKKENESY